MLAARRKLYPYLVLITCLAGATFVYFCSINLLNLQRELKHSSLNAQKKISQDGRNFTQKLPGAIIIGARKAGTRALLMFLNLHPKVTSVLTELHFFSSQYYRGLDWYRSQMPEVEGDTSLVVEKCPDYFIHPDAAHRIYQLKPDTKIILIVRDPVERAISDYCQLEDVHQQNGGVSGSFPKFEQMAFKDSSLQEVNSTWRPIEVGKYVQHLFMWMRFFPLEQIYIVSGEGLTSDPANEMAGVQQFLGLERLVTKKNFHFSEAKGFWCYRKEKGEPEVCLGKSKGRPHPLVTPEALRQLRIFYQPWNNWFYEIIGMDFKWPNP